MNRNSKPLSQKQRAAIEYAIAQDTVTFENHPGTTWFLREPFPDEFDDLGFDPFVVVSYRLQAPEGMVKGRIPVKDLEQFAVVLAKLTQ